MKKFLAVITALVTLVLAAIIVIPFVVDVDKYRPQIVQAVNDRINGKFDLGKLSLSLWGQIRVEVAGVQLADSQGRKMVSVKDAFFHLPFASLWTGSPLLTFKMQKPELAVVKDKSGKLNLLSLMKAEPAAPPASAAPIQGRFVIPGLAAQARLGVEILSASLTYQDEALSREPQRVRDLNLIFKDISLSRPTQFEVWAEIDSQMGISGPFRISGEGTPHLNHGQFDYATLSIKADFDSIEVKLPGFFEKRKGVVANAVGILKASAQEVSIQKFDLKFFNAEFNTTGSITHLAPKQGEAAAAPVAQVTIQSNEIALKPWSELIPMLKDFELGGSANFQASANGPAGQLNYQAKLALEKITAKAPMLKAKPQIDGTVKIITDQIENFTMSVKAPGNDLQISGKLVSFTKPHLDLQVTSGGMDLDQLIDFPPPAPAKSSAQTGGGSGGSGSGGSEQSSGHPVDKKAAVDFDALLIPLRENKMMQALVVNMGVNMKMLQAYQVKMADLMSKVSFKDLVGSIDQFSMGLWSGSIKTNATMDLKPKAPAYRFNAEVAGLDLKQAVSSQKPMFKNTLLGKASFKIVGSGSSFNPGSATKNLNAKGNLKVEKATFATIDVGKMAADAINQTVSKLGDKIPALKGKGLGGAPGRESRYDIVQSDFSIVNGIFSAPNFVAKAEPKQGIDLKGDTTLGLTDFSIKAAWELSDTYNFTNARDLSVEQAGVKVDHILAEGERPVRFPVHVGCTMLSPCYSYTEVPEFLGKVAMANTTHAVEGKAKAELKKRAEEKAKELLQNAPPGIQEKAKDLTKKLFGG